MKTEKIFNNPNFFIFTGGPGVGKTATLVALKKNNFRCIDEGARKIIIERARMNADSYEWRQSLEFRELVMRHSIDDYIKASTDSSQITFFDRGIPDSCYLNPPAEFDLAARSYRYNSRVFIFPPWKEIYRKDKERIQSFDEALMTFDATKKIYEEYNYELVEVPKATLEERVKFIISNTNLK